MAATRVLFVTHTPRQCGVYEFGKNVFEALKPSLHYEFIKAECESFEQLISKIKEFDPTVIIYNYHPTVLPWLSSKLTKGIYRNYLAGIRCIQVGIIHEVTQEIADNATGYRNKYILGPSQKRLNSLFDYYIAPDPTLLLKNPIVYKTGRLIPKYEKLPVNNEAVIGSFGFATPNKGFENLVTRVQYEYDNARIRLNMPSADFGDSDGSRAKAIAENCRKILTKPGIKLEITHDFMNEEQLLDFLAYNTVNVFMYEDKKGRGISSAVDKAMAVKKPVAVSRCPMFRHILNVNPSVCTEDASLTSIVQNGFGPLKKLADEWNAENLRWDYERILNSIFSKKQQPSKPRMGIVRTIQSVFNRIVTKPDKSFTWLRNTEAVTEDDLSYLPAVTYEPVKIPQTKSLNRILDDDARELYAPSVKKLFELVPSTMSKKIPRANVQQGFVFDTVYRYAPTFNHPRILCVGSYEDTASMALRRMGFDIDEIDPMVNYYLQEFCTKPSVKKDSYDIIFSTSVIEHDPDDESFIKCVFDLLAPGGIAVLTLDYKDGWKPGEPKPDVDARFYTKNDLQKRLLSNIPGANLVDVPDWDCEKPDFNYLGKYQYGFASFVFRKNLTV